MKHPPMVPGFPRLIHGGNYRITVAAKIERGMMGILSRGAPQAGHAVVVAVKEPRR